MSTAYHPRSNGQVERVNQSLEQYLRVYCSHQQDDWKELLPFAQFSHNNSVHASTGQSPFYANYGQHPTAAPKVTERPAGPDSESRVRQIQRVHTDIASAMSKAQALYKRFFDRKAMQAPQLNLGDKVWLLARNIKTDRPSRKLSHKRLGPYEITEQIGSSAFRLRLPRSLKLHNVFHVSLLEPLKQDKIPGRYQPPPPPVKTNDGYEWEVHEILDSRIRHKKLEYLVSWKGKTPDFNSWEAVDNVANAQRLVQNFHRRYPARPSATSPQQRRSTVATRERRLGRRG
jgi:hypothetical protein